MRPGFEACDHGELGGAVELACFDAIEHLGRIDGGSACDASRQVLCPLIFERADARFASAERSPRGIEGASDRGGGADAGHDDG